MSRQRIAWYTAMALLTLLVTVSAPAFPQEQPAQEATPEPEGDATIETILREQEEALSGQHFSYEPAGRRDPFMSLITNVKEPGEKLPGVKGMMPSELNLQGIVNDAVAGPVAMVIGNDNKGYFLHVGDEVYKATVIGVDPRRGAVTFRQEVDDPRLIKPYRDVELRLIPLDEESADE